MTDKLGSPISGATRWNPKVSPVRGPGRPSTGVRIDIRIPPDLLAEVDAGAEGWRVTRAHMIRVLIELGVTTWRNERGWPPNAATLANP